MQRSSDQCFLLMIQEIRLANIDSIIVHEWWRFICWNLSITHLIKLTSSKAWVETFRRTRDLYCWIMNGCSCRALKKKKLWKQLYKRIHVHARKNKIEYTLRSSEKYLHGGAIQARRRRIDEGRRRGRRKREAMNTRETEREISVDTRMRRHGERERERK